MTKLAQTKVILCGKVVEVYRGVHVPFRGKGGGRSINPVRRADAGLRARRMVRWLSACNADPKSSYFFTATFADDIQDYDKALIIWKKFMRKMRKEFPEIRYIAVPEIQPRSGRWHFHALFVGLPCLSDMRIRYGTHIAVSGLRVDFWQLFFTRLWSECNNKKSIHRCMIEPARSIGGVCGYLAKYLCKDVGGVVPVSRKNYYAGGKNLKRPIIKIGEQFAPLGFAEYHSEWKGRFGELSTFDRYII